MVAPIDAKASFEVEGEQIVLRLNFRAIALADENGIDLLGEGLSGLSTVKAITVLKCLGAQDQPDYSEDQWLAVVLAEPEEMKKALISLFTNYGGKSEGNAKSRKPKKS